MFRIGVWSNPWIIRGVLTMIGLQLLLTYVPVMNRLFHAAPLDGLAWVPILAVSLLAYLIVGLEKWIRRRLTAKRSGARRPGEGG